MTLLMREDTLHAQFENTLRRAFILVLVWNQSHSGILDFDVTIGRIKL